MTADEIAEQVRRLEAKCEAYEWTIARQQKEIADLRDKVGYMAIAWRCCGLSAKRKREIIEQARAKT